MSEEMKLLKALCDALGFDITQKQTPQSVGREASMNARGGGLFDDGFERGYEYKLTPKSTKGV